MNQECISEMISHLTMIKLIPLQNVKPVILVAACTALLYAADVVENWPHVVVIVEVYASGRVSSHWITYLAEECPHVLWHFVKVPWLFSRCLEHYTNCTVSRKRLWGSPWQMWIPALLRHGASNLTTSLCTLRKILQIEALNSRLHVRPSRE